MVSFICVSFEGRLVHEAMAALRGYRLGRITRITLFYVMNVFMVLNIGGQPSTFDDSNVYELFSEENLYEDIQRSVNVEKWLEENSEIWGIMD
jgi:ATP-dependent Lhr-like helicase